MRKIVSTLFVLLLVATTAISAQRMSGKASYYADRFHGRPTSTGEAYNKDAFTAASKEFPVGTILRVRNIANNRVTQVRVNDCGPHHPERIIDLSRAAAAQIDLLRAGVAVVQLEVLSLGTEGMACDRPRTQKPTTAAATTPAAPTTGSTVAVTPQRASAPQDPNANLPSGADEVFPLYGVQVAAYGKSTNADIFISQNSGSMGYLFKRTGAKLTRVFAGPFLSRNDAEAKAAELKKDSKLKGMVVRRVQ